MPWSAQYLCIAAGWSRLFVKSMPSVLSLAQLPMQKRKFSLLALRSRPWLMRKQLAHQIRHPMRHDPSGLERIGEKNMETTID